MKRLWFLTTFLTFLDVSLKASAFLFRQSDVQQKRLPTLAMYNLINIDENAERDIVTFDQWLSVCGVQRVDGFQLTPVSEQPLDVGVMTTQDLPAQSPIAFVPNEMMLSANRAKEEIGTLDAAEKRLVSAKAAEHVPKFYLFLKILKEFELGDQSPYYPWLNSLPRYFSNGASMTPFCFDCLPPLAANLAMGERIKFIQCK